jgi:hypothetical protein
MRLLRDRGFSQEKICPPKSKDFPSDLATVQWTLRLTYCRLTTAAFQPTKRVEIDSTVIWDNRIWSWYAVSKHSLLEDLSGQRTINKLGPSQRVTALREFQRRVQEREPGVSITPETYRELFGNYLEHWFVEAVENKSELNSLKRFLKTTTSPKKTTSGPVSGSPVGAIPVHGSDSLEHRAMEKPRSALVQPREKPARQAVLAGPRKLMPRKLFTL